VPIGIFGAVLTYYINLEASGDRREAMVSVWGRGELTRIPAVDGAVWSDGTFDHFGRYNWSKPALEALIEESAILKEYMGYYRLMPREYGCNLSHELAWKTFLKTRERYCVILEDDTEPAGNAITSGLGSSLEGVSPGVDLLYLFSCSHPGDRIRTLPDGRVRAVRSLMGYRINRKAAELMVRAAHPAVYQTDWQIPFRLSEPLKTLTRDGKLHPNVWEDLPVLDVRGVKEPLVKHSKLAKISTFTSTGDKLWIPKFMLP
jgi:hypothetical protein